MCLCCTRQGSEQEHLAVASVRLHRHLFTSRLCDTDGLELKIHTVLYLWPNSHYWIQPLESEIAVLNLSSCLPVSSGNVNIVRSPWCLFCPLGLSNTELHSVDLFSYVLLRINHCNQRNVIKYKGTQGKKKAHGKSVLWGMCTDEDIVIARHWESFTKGLQYLVSYACCSFVKVYNIFVFKFYPVSPILSTKFIKNFSFTVLRPLKYLCHSSWQLRKHSEWVMVFRRQIQSDRKHVILS